MKKTKKILAAALVSASLFSSVGAFNAFAASSVSGSIGGHTCTGSLHFSDNRTGATAATSYPASASIDASVDVLYFYNGSLRHATAFSNNIMGGTYATAHTENDQLAQSASGTHKVTLSSGAYWLDFTSIS